MKKSSITKFAAIGILVAVIVGAAVISNKENLQGNLSKVASVELKALSSTDCTGTLIYDKTNGSTGTMNFNQLSSLFTRDSSSATDCKYEIALYDGSKMKNFSDYTLPSNGYSNSATIYSVRSNGSTDPDLMEFKILDGGSYPLVISIDPILKSAIASGCIDTGTTIGCLTTGAISNIELVVSY